MTRTLVRTLAPLIVGVMAISACGSDATDEVSAADTDPPPEEEVVEAPEADAPTDAPADDVAAPAVDVVAEVGLMTSSLPEGWLLFKTVEDFEQAVTQTDPLVIDVREESEYAEGHIPGAVNIPIRTLAANVESIPMDTPVIVYCQSGYRAGLATAALRSLGYDNVRAFGGSYKAWTAAEKEVSTDPVALPAGEAKDIPPEMLEAADAYLAPMPEGYLNVKDVELMQAAMDAGAYVVDVREAGEYAEGHLPGAVSVPLRTLMDASADFPTDRQVIVYCKSGYRAALANAALGVAGFDNVKAFAGSYNAWTDAGLDVEV